MLTNNLSVGSPVAFTNYSSYGFAAVTKKTPKGRVTLSNGMVFNEYGHQLKSEKYSYPKEYLTSVEQAEQFIAQKNHDNEVQHKVNALISSLSGKKNSYGVYFLSEEQIALVEKLNATFTKK